MTQPLLHIAGIGLVVADVARATAFYTAIGFTAAAPGRLTCGTVHLDLKVATGEPYPEPRAAPDPWFQHFAIAVADIDAAAGAALSAGAMPISRDGPQRLPPNTGGVTAWKFRDPDGHPLELSYLPGSEWLRDAAAGALFLGLDHTAIAAADLALAQAWYARLGFSVAGRSTNTGPEQDRLDGLDGVVLDIVALTAPGRGPHVELLCYRTPRPAASRVVGDGDIAATVTLLGGHRSAAWRDPDGHRLVVPHP